MATSLPQLLKGWRLVCALVLALFVAAGVAAWELFSDKLSVSSVSGGVAIQTLWFGEYYTPVSRLVIYEVDSGKEVVRFVAKNNNARVYTVTVRAGVNQFADTYLADYSVSYPAGTAYAFKSGAPYKVAVTWKYRTQERSFTLP